MINLGAVFVANGAAILLLLILIISASKNHKKIFSDEKIFFTMVTITIIQAVIETITFMVDGVNDPTFIFISWLSNTLCFMLNICFAFVWTIYTDYKIFASKERIKKIYPYVFIPALCVIICCIVNIFTPVFFTISSDNIYERTKLFPLSYIFTYLYLAYGVVLIYSEHKKKNQGFFVPAIIFMIPIFIFSVIQLFAYGYSLIWLGVAIALVSLYITVQNRVSYIDNLSGLFNRSYIHQYISFFPKIKNDKSVLAGIILDIDNFKEINDNFGHTIGDDAIITFAKILKEEIPSTAAAIRYGGDEFLILLSITEESEINVLIDNIHLSVSALNNSNEKEYRLNFSHGYSIYKKNDTFDQFFTRMDKFMYRTKQTHNK